ncbi:hypothetical protein GJ496_000526 [Pomphorhynchus laevis]|nr:hypothetical protein GJ496_000526 [Pomphorhynchus laevis]
MKFGSSTATNVDSSNLQTSQSLDEGLKTLHEFLRQFNKIAEHCFTDCINDFSSRRVQQKENDCVSNCVMKYMKMTQRVSLRFKESQMIINESEIELDRKLRKS